MPLASRYSSISRLPNAASTILILSPIADPPADGAVHLAERLAGGAPLLETHVRR
jgi:hypothetical protein